MLNVSLEPGSLIQFFYPRHNYRGVLFDRPEPRRLLVEKVVDFRDDEEPDGSYPMEPDLRRGKLLVVGYDLDKHATRRFYVESMSELRELDRSKQLPPLKTILVSSDGHTVSEIPDPREGFAEAFNRCGQYIGAKAVA